MKKLKLAFLGSPDFAATFLEKLLTDGGIPAEVKIVVTQEDKPVGRKQIQTPSPVKTIALAHNIPTVTSLEQIDKQIDIALLFAYGVTIPRKVLDIPKYGFWNIHPSLLPKYRGPSPIATPLRDGVTQTGVVIIKMDEKLDHGPIIASTETEILPKERCSELSHRLSELGYDLFKDTISRFVSQNYSINMKTQDDAQATHTKLLTKKDGFIPLEQLKKQTADSPEKLFNQFRGLYPWPGIWTNFQDKRLKITDLDLENNKLVVKKVQLEGKKEVDYKTFSKAYGLTL